MKRNVKLLLKTADRIEKIPESYDQSKFSRPEPRSPCGVAGCLAGEIIIASAPTVEKGIAKLIGAKAPATLAARLIGMPKIVEAGIFRASATDWPEPFRGKWYRARSHKGKANAASGLLRYLAKGGEV